MKRNFPNIITSLNLLCGCVAVAMAFSFRPAWALFFMLAGAVFDFADGLVARALGVSSPIGKELDSLADCITFGLAPAAMIFSALSALTTSPALPFIAFLLAAFSAVRLAKFNIDTRQATSFIGLPTPACALFWGSLLASCGSSFRGATGMAILIILLFISCFLLVCGLPMFAMKFKHWGLREPGNKLKYSFIALSVIALIACGAAGNVILAPAIIVAAYILLSIALWIKAK
ncbi:MAG: CDP-diacylglycerol--serine O-phosphatidyltransferase [Prevotella sp.]|nr:CDP-diacylglycerol--serine O-phosphatidyltransferase [Prevotella sp.]